MTTLNPQTITVDQTHAEALAALDTIAGQVRYACEFGPGPRTEDVRAWLSAYGYDTKRPYVSTLVTGYREARSMDDTGDLPALTPEVLAELDAATPEAMTAEIEGGTYPVSTFFPAPPSVPTTPPPAYTPTESVRLSTRLPLSDADRAAEARERLIAERLSASVVTPLVGVQTSAPVVETAPVAVQTGPTSDEGESKGKPRGTGPFYVVALACSGLSLDTAARFFSERLHINGLLINGFSAELAAVCGIGELTLVACGYAMRHNVRRDGKPGPAQLVALAMCAAATFMAIALDGPVGGTVRGFFGPVLALVTLHLALGIEVKVRPGGRSGTWSRVVRELRERALSRLGLADDARDALARTRDRASDRAARLAAAPGWVPFRRVRLARAVRASGVALDDAQKARMLRQVAAYNNLGVLIDMESASPWS